MSDRIKDLLGDVADGVEPGDRLDAIRAAAASERRTGRGWWAAGGVGLLAASVVTALALTGTPAERGADQGPVDSPSPTATEPSPTDFVLDLWVYYAGETPDGLRLYREQQSARGTDFFSALGEAMRSTPVDPDYVNLWPDDAIEQVTSDGMGADRIVRIMVDPAYRARPASMSPVEASLAVEQVVRTFQEATEPTVAIQFQAGDNPIDQVLGVPTSEPLAPGDLFQTLALVSLSEPLEGQMVDKDEPFTVKGLGNSFEGNIVTRIQRSDGSEALDPLPTIAGWGEDRLFPFEVIFDLTDLAPGDYVVLSQTDDPSGEGRFHVDTRRITIVD